MSGTGLTNIARRRAPGRDRHHVQPGRPRKLLVSYTDVEFATIAQAARDAGLTPTGYAAGAALVAAEAAESPHTAPWRSALLELMEARAQVRRIGVNLNQAARALNSSREPPVWLERAATIAHRALTRVDEAAASAVRHDSATSRPANKEQPPTATKPTDDDQPRERPFPPAQPVRGHKSELAAACSSGSSRRGPGAPRAASR